MVVHVSSLDQFRSGRRLAERLRGHDPVRAAVEAAQASLKKRPDAPAQMSAWNDAVLGLFEANLGEAVVLNFLRLSGQWPAQRSMGDVVAVGRAVWDIGQVAGSRLAQALLAEVPKVLARLA